MSELSVDDVVAEVNRLTLRTGLKAVERLGRYLLETFFDGDTGRFARLHGEHATWRALGKHPKLTSSASTLWFAVRTVEQLEQLPAEIGRRLTATHHRYLIPLDEGLRHELSVVAARDGWSVRQLRAEIARRAPPEDSGIGRTRVISALARQAAAAAGVSDAVIRAMGPEERATLRTEVEAGIAAVEALTVRVGIALRGRVPEVAGDG